MLGLSECFIGHRRSYLPRVLVNFFILFVPVYRFLFDVKFVFQFREYFRQTLPVSLKLVMFEEPRWMSTNRNLTKET